MAGKRPAFTSKYRTVEVSHDLGDGVEVTFPVEVLDESETEQQKALRLEAVTRSYGIYKEKTELTYAKRVEKLFYLDNEADIMKALLSDVGPSMTSKFRYRSYADLLEEKLPLITNAEYKKAVQIAIKSLREYGVIHPKLKEVLNRIIPKA